MPWAGWACATGCKPDPEGYLRTLAALRPSAGEDLGASQCLVVEDSLAGVASAKAVGKRAVGVAHTLAPGRLRHAGADVILPRLADLTPGWVPNVRGDGAGRLLAPAADSTRHDPVSRGPPREGNAP